ncbi:cupin domain-containing protein [Virgibacillus doumboii]|uniref:cupin domain-containing protein n=1 Tax=Virgibacillus doumboii TaxID=2697503 RepID=UPI0013DECA9E|nr:cupin domain-containing protein [Virgibacillus doumboii]
MKLISVDHEITKPVFFTRLFGEDNREVVNVKLQEGEIVKEHDSPKHVFIFVNSGDVEFTVSGEKHTVNAETVLYMEPYERHALKALSDVSILVMKC